MQFHVLTGSAICLSCKMLCFLTCSLSHGWTLYRCFRFLWVYINAVCHSVQLQTCAKPSLLPSALYVASQADNVEPSHC